MEQMVITASPEFFKDLGWDKNAAKIGLTETFQPELKNILMIAFAFAIVISEKKI